jgi:hypothetical protein
MRRDGSRPTWRSCDPCHSQALCLS